MVEREPARHGAEEAVAGIDELDRREGAGIGLPGDLRERRQRHQREGGDEQRRNETAGPHGVIPLATDGAEGSRGFGASDPPIL